MRWILTLCLVACEEPVRDYTEWKNAGTLSAEKTGCDLDAMFYDVPHGADWTSSTPYGWALADFIDGACLASCAGEAWGQNWTDHDVWWLDACRAEIAGRGWIGGDYIPTH